MSHWVNESRIVSHFNQIFWSDDSIEIIKMEISWEVYDHWGKGWYIFAPKLNQTLCHRVKTTHDSWLKFCIDNSESPRYNILKFQNYWIKIKKVMGKCLQKKTENKKTEKKTKIPIESNRLTTHDSKFV